MNAYALVHRVCKVLVIVIFISVHGLALNQRVLWLYICCSATHFSLFPVDGLSLEGGSWGCWAPQCMLSWSQRVVQVVRD